MNPMNRDPRADVSIPVMEEQLEVRRELVDTGRPLRLRKEVDEVPATVWAPLTVESVQVDRVSIGRVVDVPPPVREEGDVTVVPVIQERLVTRKELVLVEEIRLTRSRKVVRAEAEVPLRRERVAVERFDPDTDRWLPESGTTAATPPNQEIPTMQTVIAAFESHAQAERAREQLVQRGFDRDDVHIEREDMGTSTTQTTTERSSEHQGGISGFFARLFGDDDYDRYGNTWNEAVTRGSSVVVVDARDERQADEAAACLHEAGAFDIDERSQQWGAQGPTAGATLPSGAAGLAPPAGTNRVATGTRLDNERVLDVVQEELQVGKRTLDRGGVRVVQRMSEKPVREVVRLREEHAVVDRRPVDRPAQVGDLNAFKEGTVEVRESAEEAVVAKNARVVEEVRVGKEVSEREEVIEDKLRRKDVDVERLSANDRDRRAVASDRDAPLSGTRDPDTTRRTDRDGPV